MSKLGEAVSELEVSVTNLEKEVNGLRKGVKFVFWIYVVIAVLSCVLWISVANAQFPDEKQSACMLTLPQPVDGQKQHPCVLPKPKRKCWICPLEEGDTK